MPAKKKTGVSAKKDRSKGKFLVIVESPAKSKTINKILGADYKVIACMGHLVDLPAGKMGIDFENDFKPEYAVMKNRKKYLTDLKKEAKSAKAVFLAADPDREGEAICWHIENQLKKLSPEIYRVKFEEITDKVIKEAFSHKGALDMNKVNAQQARRILDRIVGYSLSPFLWGKITRGLSAGRVQSVAVRLIVEREDAIRAFKPQEYWSLDAILRKRGVDEKDDAPSTFKAKLVKHKGEKVHMEARLTVDDILAVLKNEKFIIKDIARKQKKSYPRSPYTTSLMQQDAFNRINFSASKTMRIAQRLYEGVELGDEGSVGLITYMRTDSVRISDDALRAVREYIAGQYGGQYCPEKPVAHRSKGRAQDAHEAIRPGLPLRDPGSVASFLNSDELKLYTLIWNRFVASQMTNAVYSVLTVNIDAGEYMMRAGGAELIFRGFLLAFNSAKQDEEMERIPSLDPGEEVDLQELLPEQHFTKAPPRYSDASLVKDLEEKGIGRPSTYAPIIRTVIDRNYVKRIARYFQPSELGELVTKLLVKNFPDTINYEFTANMENELDGIEEGNVNWVKVLKDFYEPFSRRLEKARERMKNVNKEEVKTDEVCAECGRPMIIKWGRRGRFLSCSGFPACRNSKSITTGVKCPEEGCSGELVERRSRRGTFYGCTNYPNCRYVAKTPPKDPLTSVDNGDNVEDE
ncbi:MAG: type I DNA topoisomerase [Candidatus Omnitrophica bacterium]|nr:type I DNA topoisomerase [Candidatus Omnitrophota bacterium]MBU1784334.1 type I DNA topoisomerase [Candidatus Omnitrophota bacterium]MBU1850786.1 type I DNA topoisomerase [Candidatus Omnitrophota bacterium]